MSYRKYGMYNQSFPQTPAPSRAAHRVPMAAAILETPSILSSFRGSTVTHRKNPTSTAIAPPAMQFIPTPSTTSWNESMMFSGNTSLSSSAGRFSSSTPAHPMELNTSLFENSFTSTPNKPWTLPTNVPLAPSNSNSILNRSMAMTEKKFSAKSTSGFPSLQNLHRTQGSNLNSTIASFTSSTSFGKRKFPDPTATTTVAAHSKYQKISQGTTPALPAMASVQEAKSVPDTKAATLRIVSGTIDHIHKIMRDPPKYPLLLETVANVVTVKCGTRPTEKVILLRAHNTGPVLQGLYYEIDADLPPFVPGDLVRCVGRIQPVGNRLQILKITRTTDQHDRAIARLQTVSAFTSKVRR